MKKTALVSLALPPSHSGQSMVIYHLLKNVDPGLFVLVTQTNYFQYHHQGQSLHPLPFPTFSINPDYQVTRALTRLACFFKSARLLDFILRFKTSQIKKILEREKTRIAIACTGDLFDPPSVFRATRELGIPLILYSFDYYSSQWTDPLLHAFAEKYESEIFRYASRVIVPNEYLCSEYQKKYGSRAVVIHNPVDLAAYQKNSVKNASVAVNERSIVYTGAVYEAHFDAFRNLLSAITKTGIPDLKLDLFCPQSGSYLKKNGITGPVELHKHLQNDQMPAVQQSAEILFLPLAFNSPYPGIINTSAPGKIGEYLASGRPILVHAPADSFVAWYFRKYSCGYVVDQDDPDKLAHAIIHLLQDKKLQQKLSDNAHKRATEDFDIIQAQKRFTEVIDSQKS
jgi:glycosyltransferase involved in cell wall biosynthesis